jgi:hypothetical protein
MLPFARCLPEALAQVGIMLTAIDDTLTMRLPALADFAPDLPHSASLRGGR